jgi:hypothetical protein
MEFTQEVIDKLIVPELSIKNRIADELSINLGQVSAAL